MIIKYFGVPGAGKTTNIVKALSRFNDTDGVWVISHTRATKQAFLSSCEKHQVDIKEKQVRTLHSFACEANGLLKDKKIGIMSSEQAKEFFDAKGFGFDTKEYKDEYEEPTKPGNKLQAHFERIRLSRDFSLSEEEHQRRYIKAHEYELTLLFGKNYQEKFMVLFREYLALQKELNAWDFTTLLEELDRYGVAMLPSGKLLILDEFHDFSPLAIRIVERMLRRFEHGLVAGDDDQVIYTFNGASPKYFLELQADREIILDRSYRLPKNIAGVANRLISFNKTRKPKRIRTDKPGGVIWSVHAGEVERVLENNEGKTILILTRHRHHLKFWQIMCEGLDIPYTIGDDLPDFFIAMKLLQELREKGSLPTYLKLVEGLKPFIRKFEKLSRIDDEKRDEIIKELRNKNLNNSLVRAIFTLPIEELFSHVDKKWIRRLNRFNEWLNPKVRLATIHSAKGLEADIVVLDSAITSTVQNNLMVYDETEIRVWYVAITRAQEGVIEVIRPNNSYIDYLGSFEEWEALVSNRC